MSLSMRIFVELNRKSRTLLHSLAEILMGLMQFPMLSMALINR